MSREMLQLAEALASEKNVESEVVFEALEFALSVAAKKKADREHMDVRVSIDRNTGEYHTFRRWLIVADEDYTYPDTQKTIEEIQEEFPDSPLQIGEYYEEELENVAFGRQAAQTAKQIILQRIRDAEREQILQEFLARREDVVMGTVKRVERHGIIVEIGRLDALSNSLRERLLEEVAKVDDIPADMHAIVKAYLLGEIDSWVAAAVTLLRLDKGHPVLKSVIRKGGSLGREFSELFSLQIDSLGCGAELPGGVNAIELALSNSYPKYQSTVRFLGENNEIYSCWNIALRI